MRPLPFTWEEGVMRPRWPRLAHEQFDPGQTYVLVPEEDSSDKSRRHFFAIVREAWQTLPELEAERFPSSEHLRKWALIRAGFRDERTIACSSKAEAQRVAAFVKPMDDYAIVVAREATVAVLTAKSQSKKAMGAADFQASKDAVLGIIADLIGVAPDTLSKHARAA